VSKKRVAVALSGGIDSSIAACLLQEAGYEVIGITMGILSEDRETCPSADNIYDAENICRTLGIPFHFVDFEQEFKQHVIDYFCREYIRGRTPNPCIACNRHIKFGHLLDSALSLGADYLATGHYARVEHRDNCYHLLKGIDEDKDQSYVLYTLGQDKLGRVLFPLGGYTKSQVRELATKKGLSAAGKHGSQDICFISGNYGAFLSRYIASNPGEIVDSSGKVLGWHGGTAFYTVGQRHGLHLSAAQPVYVTRIDSENNRLVVGTEKELYRFRFEAADVRWVSGSPPAEPMALTVKIRYRAPDVAAIIYPVAGMVDVNFISPQAAVAPGQAVVFYLDDEVIGGGTIES
jgi:tRNA-specific 2-thiouridylase